METMTRRYEHTIPSGHTLTFEVSPSRYDAGCILVSYPDHVDLSPYQSRDAYPLEEISKDWGAFHFCVAYGTDYGTSWELWELR